MPLSGRGGARATFDRKRSIPPPRSVPAAGYPAAALGDSFQTTVLIAQTQSMPNEIASMHMPTTARRRNANFDKCRPTPKHAKLTTAASDPAPQNSINASFVSQPRESRSISWLSVIKAPASPIAAAMLAISAVVIQPAPLRRGGA
jgi:hypothetical protein